MASVALKSVSKQYGSKLVVEEFDLEVKDGEFIVLLGPSGCGKTTTLRMIAGLESLSSGELFFGEKPVNDIPPEDRNVGMVFQNYALYPHMSVFDNLVFGLRSRRVPKAQAAKAVSKVAKLLEIEHVLTHKPRELSGGQRQRVALGRAIVREPSVFLMDEPLSNLDANLRERMRIELAQLHARLGITTFYVTHDQGEALTLSDRIVIMDQGKVRQIGTSEEVYSKPNDTFVARFIGSPGMNLWNLEWTDGPDSILAGESVQVPTLLRSAMSRIGKVVTIGVRPEHLFLSSSGTGDVVVCLDVLAIERLGSHVQLNGVLTGNPSLTVVAKLDAGVNYRRGEKICLYAKPESVYLFDPLTERRVEVFGQ